MTAKAPRTDRFRLRSRAGLIVAIGLLAAGCGSVGYTEGTGDKANGKKLFVERCGSCHTLADAGTTGQIGPNLDDAFAESRKNGLGESSFVQVVRGQIAYPIAKTSTGAPGMPKGLAEGQDADDIASYVASVAGTGAAAAQAAAPSP
jgi:mono/diheme cytochrome c family protein